MGTIDDYLADLDPADRAAISRVYDVVRAALPDLEQGKSYGMPALMYQGKALIAVMCTRKHLGIYPFSGRVPGVVAESEPGLDYDKGTIRFSPQAPLPDALVHEMIAARLARIA